MFHDQNISHKWHVFVILFCFFFLIFCPEPSVDISGASSFQVQSGGSPMNFPALLSVGSLIELGIIHTYLSSFSWQACGAFPHISQGHWGHYTSVKTFSVSVRTSICPSVHTSVIPVAQHHCGSLAVTCMAGFGTCVFRVLFFLLCWTGGLWIYAQATCC